MVEDVRIIPQWWQRLGPRFNIKMTSYQYRKSHCGDKTILQPSYLQNGISYTIKTTSLYSIGALGILRSQYRGYRCPGVDKNRSSPAMVLIYIYLSACFSSRRVESKFFFTLVNISFQKMRTMTKFNLAVALSTISMECFCKQIFLWVFLYSEIGVSKHPCYRLRWFCCWGLHWRHWS